MLFFMYLFVIMFVLMVLVIGFVLLLLFIFGIVVGFMVVCCDIVVGKIVMLMIFVDGFCLYGIVVI